MSFFIKVIPYAVALGGSGAAVAGVSGAFSDGSRTFLFLGGKTGSAKLHCPFQEGKYAKPVADVNAKQIKCEYEGDNGSELEVRWWGDSDNEESFKCTKQEGFTYSCASSANKTFSLKKPDETAGSYLKVTVDP
ncbi:hypothetical protein MHLP_01845 [Candidatus Mycoplasma haematolamae str. Purdue]|uniref:Ig-like domain-containing protein n=1 Tax=Mycoplasma haematolamae (strain Purdue) TaxID=1212765 RepID=I7CJD8_MYCHA|nr:hypothetical protein [Candidatus Mycoplasma haematolamae]AFO51949.1 hypothetical protein MHLP_01845 [Candidatus Mycoplasma haematolamae str. Purdue]